MARGPVNLRRGLREGELPRRYWRLRGEHVVDDEDDLYLGDSEDVSYDDYWNPWNQTTPLDFALEKLWHGLSEIALSGRIQIPRRRPATVAELRASDADALVDALYAHVQQLVDSEPQHSIERQFEAPRAELRDAVVREPRLLGWIGRHRGPTLMMLLLSPFWVRSLDGWVPPAGSVDDDDALSRSLLEHLFARFPIPPTLFTPWLTMTAPSLKWAAWLVLIGGGASMRRAAPRFGWRISTGLVHHLHDAPERLQPIEAIVWAELAQRGGAAVDFARLRRHAAFIFDTTITRSEGAIALDEEHERPVQYRAFWIATVDWLVRHRDTLTDESCQPILSWAMHRFTEDLARGTPANLCFTWSGRTPTAAHEQAEAYAREIQASRYGYLQHLAWPLRGWDWRLAEGAHEWTIRELASSRELAAESAAMHHCVGSYTHRCVAGISAIFSARLDGDRVFTIELEPGTRRVVQARGVANRACTETELALVARWLDTTKPSV
ncbi:MAG: PcfJ domain-containing protein [Kofleriaceae bacterium]